VYILLSNSCVKFHSKLAHTELSTKVKGIVFCPVEVNGDE